MCLPHTADRNDPKLKLASGLRQHAFMRCPETGTTWRIYCLNARVLCPCRRSIEYTGEPLTRTWLRREVQELSRAQRVSFCECRMQLQLIACVFPSRSDVVLERRTPASRRPDNGAGAHGLRLIGRHRQRYVNMGNTHASALSTMAMHAYGHDQAVHGEVHPEPRVRNSMATSMDYGHVKDLRGESSKPSLIDLPKSHDGRCCSRGCHCAIPPPDPTTWALQVSQLTSMDGSAGPVRFSGAGEMPRSPHDDVVSSDEPTPFISLQHL